MQRYAIGYQSSGPSITGRWVEYADAETEIRAAEERGRLAVHDERERCVNIVLLETSIFQNHEREIADRIINRIRSREKEAGPNPINKISIIQYDKKNIPDIKPIIQLLNDIVDRVNDLSEGW